MRKFICFCFAVAVLAVGNVALVQQAQGRWKSEYAEAPYREWFAQQRDGEGWSCCDLSDAHPVYDAYIRELMVSTTKSSRSSCSAALIRLDMQSFGTTVLAIT